VFIERQSEDEENGGEAGEAGHGSHDASRMLGPVLARIGSSQCARPETSLQRQP
jgi:hypothetical protein